MSKSGGFSMKRTVCAVATATLAASGLFVSAAHAVSDPIQYGDINKQQPASLTIHKFESGSLTGTPTAVSPGGASGKAVNGVVFKLYDLGLDLGTVEGWAKVTGLNVPVDACTAQGAADFSKLAEITGTSTVHTSAATQDGMTTVNAPVGAYLVCEQPSSNATNADGNSVSVVKVAAPFVVTLPRPDAGGTNGWIYNVHAYPKNTVIEAPKKVATVRNKGINTDAGVEYTITTKVPSILNTQNFKLFSVIDQMPTELTGANVAQVALNGVTLTAGDSNDYVVDYQEGQRFLSVNFSSSGLAKLKADPNTSLVVTIQAKVSAISGTKIVNTGYVVFDVTDGPVPSDPPQTPVTPGGPGNDPSPKENVPPVKPSNKSASTWGDLKIRKHDAAQQNTPLNGAEFQVFDAANQGDCTAAVRNGGKFQADQIASVTTGAAIKVGEKSTFTTEGNGEIVIPGLFIDSVEGANGGVPEPETARCYIVKETKAPAGFVLPEEVDRTFAIMVEVGTSTDADLDMPNTKVSVPALPLTGASGRVLLMVGGLALVLGSMGVVMVIRKRNAEA